MFDVDLHTFTPAKKQICQISEVKDYYRDEVFEQLKSNVKFNGHNM